jgi:alkyl hydroperoxide reductase subunit AhpF
MHTIEDSPELAATLKVDKIPATVIRGQSNRPIRYFGIPSGTLFGGFIDTLVDASRGEVDLKPETVRQLRKLRSDLNLQVLVTTGCQYSPAMARTAVKFALQSNRVKVDVIEVGEFPQLVQRYGLRAVPVTVFEDKLAVPGVMPEETLLQVGIRVLEGKPLSGQLRTGPSTALVMNQPQQQQPAMRTSATSGLILPR